MTEKGLQREREKKKNFDNFKRENPLMHLQPYLKHLSICLQRQAFERIFQSWKEPGGDWV